MMTSLFGHLVWRFTPHPENLATEALAYILRNSRTARAAFLAHLAEFGLSLPTDLVFRTQAADTDNAIPDLVGCDESGQPVVIVEAKFWAGLTDNQPAAYLKRLPPDVPGLLVFIAPEARFQTLWPELFRRCGSRSTMGQPPAVLATQALRLQASTYHCLGLTSWRAVLGALDARLAAAGEDAIRADVQQLAGLCERMDSDAFLPIKSDEFSPLIGRRIGQYCALIDDVVARLVTAGVANNRGLRTAASAGRWGQYIRLRGNACLLYFFAHAWATYRETPLWLWVRDHEWKTTAELRTALLPLEREIPPRVVIDEDGQLLVPISLPTGVERDAVISQVESQVRDVAALLPDHSDEPASDHAPEPTTPS